MHQGRECCHQTRVSAELLCRSWTCRRRCWLLLLLLVLVTVASPLAVVHGQPSLALGYRHTCALTAGGAVRCWGNNDYAQLGLGHTHNTSSPGAAVQLGSDSTAVEVHAGDWFTCAVLGGGRLKCWGDNSHGQLGLGRSARYLGDTPGELGDALPYVDLGTGLAVEQLALGGGFACAIVTGARVKCWGDSEAGQLGYGTTYDRGVRKEDMSDSLPFVDLGPGLTAVQLAAGAQHVCALLSNNAIKCWGSNGNGRLGLGSTGDRGGRPGQMGSALPAVALGTGLVAVKLALGGYHSCALLNNGGVKCWGSNFNAQLGLGDSRDRGNADADMGGALPLLDLADVAAVDLATGDLHSCVMLSNHSIKCWGTNSAGQLGLGSTQTIGDKPGEIGQALLPVAVGGGHMALGIRAGGDHTCVLMSELVAKCWGKNHDGQLGLGDLEDRGDGPGEMGDALPTLGVWLIDVSPPPSVLAAPPPPDISPRASKAGPSSLLVIGVPVAGAAGLVFIGLALFCIRRGRSLKKSTVLPAQVQPGATAEATRKPGSSPPAGPVPSQKAPPPPPPPQVARSNAADIVGRCIRLGQDVVTAAQHVVANESRCSRVAKRVAASLSSLERLKERLGEPSSQPQESEVHVSTIATVYGKCRTVVEQWRNCPGGLVGAVRSMLASKEYETHFTDLHERLTECDTSLACAMRLNKIIIPPARDTHPSLEQLQEDADADLHSMAQQLMATGWSELTPEERERTLDYCGERGLDLSKLPEQARQRLQMVISENLLIAWDDLHIQPEPIAEEGRAAVHLATYHGRAVTVAMLPAEGVAEESRARVQTEAWRLTSLHHPNVAQMRGLVSESSHYALVMHYYPRGDLLRLLQSDDAPQSWRDRLTLAVGAARGLYYLHSLQKPIVHGDVRISHLLLGEELQVVLRTDVNVLRLISSHASLALTSAYNKSSALALGYYAPELMEAAGAAHTTQSDVFSLGMVLYEIATLVPPFGQKESQSVRHSLRQGLRPIIPSGVPTTLAELMNRCWAQDPAERPSMKQVLDTLEAIKRNLSQVETKQQNWVSDRQSLQHRDQAADEV